MDVYGLGTLAIDVLMKVDMLPVEDGFCMVKSSERQPGGSGTNVIVQLARLSAKCGYIGAVGDDGLGQDVIKSLDEEGVYTGNMVIRPGKTTLHTDIVIDDHGSKFIMLNMGDAFDSLTLSDIDKDEITDAKIFYTDLLPGKAAAEALKAAKLSGAQTVVNLQVNVETMEGLGVSKDEILDLLKYVDIFAPCRGSLKALTGTDDLAQCAKILRTFCPGIYLFTLGKDGSAAYDSEGKNILVPAQKIDPIDTTGAGDSYLGAFIYQYCLCGIPLNEAMEFATLCSAYTCLGLGARHTPTLAQINEFKEV